MYCGDETGAFIGDVGSHTARFGYGGEDCPKVVVPSAVYRSAIKEDSNSATNTTSNNNNNNNNNNHSNVHPRWKYTAPVSMMRMPPDSCFTIQDDGSYNTEIGYIPIYSSLNSNNNKEPVYYRGRTATTTTTTTTTTIMDGAIDDIDAWAALWEYSYQTLCVRGRGKHTLGHKHDSYEPELRPEEGTTNGPIDHPILAVDSTRPNTPIKEHNKQRALMLETLFESLSAPAAYIAPTSVLSSFAFGRKTSLVVDIGHTGTSVTPVFDGYCLSYGCVSSGRGGAWLGSVQKRVLEGIWNDDGETPPTVWNGWWGRNGVRTSSFPPCQGDGVVPRYVLHDRCSPRKSSINKLQVLKQSAFHSMAVHEVMYEMMTSSHIIPLKSSKQASTPFCGYGESNGNNMEIEGGNEYEDEIPMDDGDMNEGSSYVLPDGTIVNLTHSNAGKDLCRLPELLFSENLPLGKNYSENDSVNMLPITKLVHKSLNEILDVDLRKELSSNIIVTGGASLFPALDQRLSLELSESLPSSCKYKVIMSKNSVESRYSAWIGGSILSSLGSFQQLWLSKREYEECGAVLGLQRFKN